MMKLPEHIVQCANKAIAVLRANPGKAYTTTGLAKACGYSGSSYDPDCDAFTKALHKSKFPKGPMGPYWRESTTRLSPFKDKDTGMRRPSVEWLYDPSRPTPAPTEIIATSEAPRVPGGRSIQLRTITLPNGETITVEYDPDAPCVMCKGPHDDARHKAALEAAWAEEAGEASTLAGLEDLV